MVLPCLAPFNPRAISRATLYPQFAAAETAEKVHQWYEVVGGILAIPVAIFGLAYSYILLTKTRLEVRKTELEIR